MAIQTTHVPKHDRHAVSTQIGVFARKTIDSTRPAYLTLRVVIFHNSPPEAHHLPCFEQWAIHKTTCASLRAKSKEDPRGELVYSKEFGIKWKDLKDQIVWRGTDFGYLGVSVVIV